MSDDLAYADEPTTGLNNLDVPAALATVLHAAATLAHPDATTGEPATVDELDAAATVVGALREALADGRLILTTPPRYCGADFMAGTECDLPEGHGGPHLATWLL